MRDVVVPQWPGTAPEESLQVAIAAYELGYRQLWFGETAAFDAGVLAGRFTSEVPRMPMVIGPLPVSLRSGPQLAMLAASVAALGSRVEIVLGASSPVITTGWHGRDRGGTVLLADTIGAARAAASGLRTDLQDTRSPTSGFRLGLPVQPLTIGMAALGPRTLMLAGSIADRVVVNFVPPRLAGEIMERVDHGARSVGRPRPPVSAWMHTGVDVGVDGRAMARRFLSNYLRAPGYSDTFRRLGFGAVLDQALVTATRDLGTLVDDEFLDELFAFGPPAVVHARALAFEDAGIEVAVVPVTTDDPGGLRTLAALRPG